MKKSVRRLQKLTVEDIKQQIAVIKQQIANNDYELAHVLEDALHQRVLHSIANDKADNSKACAKMALSTRRLKFNRLCS